MRADVGDNRDSNALELYNDYFCFLDACIWRVLIDNGQGETLGHRFKPEEDGHVNMLVQKRRKSLLERMRQMWQSTPFLPLLQLKRVLALSEFETDVVAIALSVEMDRKYGWVFGHMLGSQDVSYPTLEIVIRLLQLDDAQQARAFKAFHPESILRKYVILAEDNRAHAMMNQAYRLSDEIRSYLLNIQSSEDGTLGDIRFNNARDALSAELLIEKETADKLYDFVSMSQSDVYPNGLSVLRLLGPKGVGKQLQVETVMHRLNRNLVSIGYAEIVEKGHRDSLRRLYLQAMLHEACVAILDIPMDLEVDKLKSFWLAFKDEFTTFQRIVFITVDTNDMDKVAVMDGVADIAMVYDIEIPAPKASDRLTLWKALLRQGNLSADVKLAELAEKFQITPGQMQAALNYAECCALWDGRTKVSAADLNTACYRQLSTNLEQKAQRMNPRVSLDAVVLPHAQLALLRQACDRIRYRSRVLDDWGFSNRLDYGTGVSMLFAGPPGTGKTMAAVALGGELNMPVYRIDLGQVISKYIGETEKNLWEIFEEAKNSSAILFFDEADALFGKRTEVKDSHDKYANVETAFLLQKMEEFNGLSLLATNILQNIDEAFTRRFTYVIRFPFPDSAHRERIWKGMFPKNVPLGDDVDFGFLAQRLEISGGLIKNIALGASFLAATEQEKVEMRHILVAARDELNKISNLFRPEEMGLYADLLR